MLTPEEQLNAVESIARVEAVASRTVGRALTATQAIEFVRTVHSNMDRLANALPPDELQPQCKAGCTFCCSAKVEVSDPEALHIAAALGALPENRLAALVKSLRAQAASRAELPISARIPCTFLQEGLCSIYAFRPSVCRKAHSLSVAMCENLSPSLPQNLSILLRCEVLTTGTNNAFERHALPAGSNELSAAVLAALVNEDAANNWFNGTPLLKQAGPSTRAHHDVA